MFKESRFSEPFPKPRCVSLSTRREGFTRIELVIVLVLAGITMGFGSLVFSGYFQRTSAQRVAQVCAHNLSLAGTTAVRTREPVVIRFYENLRWYEVESQTSTVELARRRFGTNADIDLSADLDDGDVVRIVANASRRAVTGGVAAITFGWSVNIALRNLR